ncbi:glutamyl-tRNA reductase [Prochlorococcus marinus]|uniref:glutamyl-tRNA reductase n=1 Tax=Prochlorococcus marinus TaxID=1219 RepID=UPI0022B2CC19|nr:glutamyl-tRNA reductase [Prochlorococcus marinus]
MNIAVVGLSHRTAPVEVREKLSISENDIEGAFNALKLNQQIVEVSILSTCNRLEIYSFVRDSEQGIKELKNFLSSHSGLDNAHLEPHLFSYKHSEAIRHVMRVAGGLDSLVLGEGQILLQVKKMVRLGQENHSMGPILNRLLTQAVSTGKRVRSETNLGTGAVSISSAAVELAQLKIGQAQGKDELVSLSSERISVVGAGRMSRLLIQHLSSKGCADLTLLNRTLERAESLASDFTELNIKCKQLDQLDDCLQNSSLVFTSTASDKPIIDASRISSLNIKGKLRLIDIGVPRNISDDVGSIIGIDSHDVDDLQEVVSRNQEARQLIAQEAENLITEEVTTFLQWWASLEAVPTINLLRSNLESIRKEELQKALSRMGPDFSARERKVVEALSKGIINKILHTPVTNLRAPQQSAQRKIALEVISSLFELDSTDSK